jgi:hypothetical protein
MKGYLAALNRFLTFKGPGFFKKRKKLGGNVDNLKAYRLIPLTPLLWPICWHMTPSQDEKKTFHFAI